MPRIIIKWSTEEPPELKHLTEQFRGIESRLLMGQNMLINFTGSAAEYLPFLQSLHSNALIESIRELCRGKCRDESDCLNTVVEGSYCRKHQPVSNREVQGINDVEGGKEKLPGEPTPAKYTKNP